MCWRRHLLRYIIKHASFPVPPRQIWRRARKTAIAIRGIVAMLVPVIRGFVVLLALAAGAMEVSISVSALLPIKFGKTSGRVWSAATETGKPASTAGDATVRDWPATREPAKVSAASTFVAVAIRWTRVRRRIAVQTRLVREEPPAIMARAVRRAIAAGAVADFLTANA